VQLCANAVFLQESIKISLKFLDRTESMILPFLDFNWLDFLTEGCRKDLPSEKVFEVLFFLGNIHLSSCWVKSPRRFSPVPSKPLAGRNNFGALWDSMIGKNANIKL
jgi:hypothetical protein